MTMTKEELKKEIERKQELVNKLNTYLMTKGHTLSTGKDVGQSINALERQIRKHKYDLEHWDVLSDDEIRAIARGEAYMSEEEKKKHETDRDFVRSILGKGNGSEVEEIREMIKAGS